MSFHNIWTFSSSSRPQHDAVKTRFSLSPSTHVICTSPAPVISSRQETSLPVVDLISRYRLIVIIICSISSSYESYATINIKRYINKAQ